MNIKSGLLSFVKSRWFERGLCLVVILSLAGFFYYRISAQQKQLESDSAQMASYEEQLQNCFAEIAGHEENAKNLLEKIDLSVNDKIKLNEEIAGYKNQLQAQGLYLQSVSYNNDSLTKRIGELESEVYRLNYIVPNENEIIIDTRIPSDVLNILIKHAKALNERDLKTYKSTWKSGEEDLYFYEEEMVIKRIYYPEYGNVWWPDPIDEYVEYVCFDVIYKESNDWTTSYYVAVGKESGKLYIVNWH